MKQMACHPKSVASDASFSQRRGFFGFIRPTQGSAQPMARAMLMALLLLGLSLAAALPAAAAPFITAAIHWTDGKAQFFLSDGSYIRYDVATSSVDPGYPKPVDDSTWPGIDGSTSRITAAFNTLDNRAMFFFANGTYTRYDILNDKADPGYPKPIDDGTWPGLGAYATEIISALNWSGTRVQFFLRDGQYVRYDLAADRSDPGYPKAIDEATWPGLAPYAAHLAGGINADGGKAFIFFDDGRYVRYDIAADRVDEGYPKTISADTWPGLHSYFRR